MQCIVFCTTNFHAHCIRWRYSMVSRYISHNIMYDGSTQSPLRWVMACTQSSHLFGACSSTQTKTAGWELNGFADRAEFQQQSRREHKAASLPPHGTHLLKGKVSTQEKKKKGKKNPNTTLPFWQCQTPTAIFEHYASLGGSDKLWVWIAL